MFEKINTELGGVKAIIVRGLGRYSLRDTLECGQCFRHERIGEGAKFKDEYILPAGTTLIRVGQDLPGELVFIDMDDETFENVARVYFALDYDLELIRKDIVSRTDSEWLVAAAEFAGGIAILRQDPWEALISFIISQNNNIPRIRKIIRSISAEYGVNLTLQSGNEARCPLNLCSGTPCQEKCVSCGVCYTFPSAIDILDRPEGLLPSRPGFRYSYILDASEKVASGELNLDMIGAARTYTHTLECLKTVRGVGDKVASCTALFGFANLEAFPIDVWMRRAIDIYFDGKLEPESLGRYAGVAQQYIFHYIRHLELKEDEA